MSLKLVLYIAVFQFESTGTKMVYQFVDFLCVLKPHFVVSIKSQTPTSRIIATNFDFLNNSTKYELVYCELVNNSGIYKGFTTMRGGSANDPTSTTRTLYPKSCKQHNDCQR